MANLVPNGDMELDSNWSDWGTLSVNIRDNTHVHGGSYSRKVIAGDDDVGPMSDVFTTETGVTYHVSVWVYPLTTHQITAYVYRGSTGTDDAPVGSNTITPTANEWNEISFDYTEVDGGSLAKLYVDLSNYGDTVWVDDASVEEGYSIVNDGADNFIISGDHTDIFTAGKQFTVSDYYAWSNGTYTVDHSSYGAPYTTIYTVESVGGGGDDGPGGVLTLIEGGADVILSPFDLGVTIGISSLLSLELRLSGFDLEAIAGLSLGSVAPVHEVRLSGFRLGVATSLSVSMQSVIPAAQTVPWGITKIKAREVNWEGYRGFGVKVAILDSGVDRNHPDLCDNIKGGYNFLAGDPSYPEYTNPDNYYDDNGHGTHVAGIIAALDNTQGVVGVAPMVSIYALKVLDYDGHVSGWATVISAIQWCIDNGMDIVSMSFGADTGSDALHEIIDHATGAHGILFVAAAGSDGAHSILYPAKYTTVIGVGATTESDGQSTSSNYGPEMGVCAPGDAIRSTLPDSTYGLMTGTSMATPHVAGTAALIKSKKLTLTNVEIRDIIQRFAVHLGTAGWNEQFGYGRVNAQVSCWSIQLWPPEVPTPPVLTPTTKKGWTWIEIDHPLWGYEQDVTVRIEASSKSGVAMTPVEYSFQTTWDPLQTRSGFGKIELFEPGA